jgi:hypothetical protein
MTFSKLAAWAECGRVTTFLIFEKSGRFHYFVTSRLLKVVVCNESY